MKKKLLALLLTACMVVSMVACGSEAEAPATSEGKELAVQIGPDPETVDPALSSAIDFNQVRLKHGRLQKMVLHGHSI